MNDPWSDFQVFVAICLALCLFATLAYAIWRLEKARTEKKEKLLENSLFTLHHTHGTPDDDILEEVRLVKDQSGEVCGHIIFMSFTKISADATTAVFVPNRDYYKQSA